MKLEICANSYQSAKNAEKAGAGRLELCTELSVGGITPSYGLLKKISEEITIPVNILIRLSIYCLFHIVLTVYPHKFY